MKLIDKIRVVLDKYNGGKTNEYAERFIDAISGVDFSKYGENEEEITGFKNYCLKVLIGRLIMQNNPNLFGVVKKGQPVIYNNEYWRVESVSKYYVKLYSVDKLTNMGCDCYVSVENIALIKPIEKNIQDNHKDTYLEVTEHCPH